jgi:hypothetical protein
MGLSIEIAERCIGVGFWPRDENRRTALKQWSEEAADSGRVFIA